jgi:AcrR family transcriptional regulator
MSSESRAGRPKASSRETLAEAACELFLEQGFEQTSIVDITQRAGVSRSSFFNYFSSKSEVLWSGLDERIAIFQLAVADDLGHAVTAIRDAVVGIGADFAPDTLALALVNTRAMGIEEELDREASLRRARIARIVAERLTGAGADRLRADVAGAAYGGAVLAAVDAWAHDGAGRTSLQRFLARAVAIAEQAALDVAATGAIRQLRVVVQAREFDSALSFYRDVVGMPEREAYEADGGARVVILDAGRATLELANTAQVTFIDGIETDGGTSDRIRIALEVDDAAAAAERWSDAGAEIEASARLTPWRSMNARLRGPADLQLTIFQELDER